MWLSGIIYKKQTEDDEYLYRGFITYEGNIETKEIRNIKLHRMRCNKKRLNDITNQCMASKGMYYVPDIWEEIEVEQSDIKFPKPTDSRFAITYDTKKYIDEQGELQTVILHPDGKIHFLPPA